MGHRFAVVDEVHQPVGVEVGDPDRLDHALLVQVLALPADPGLSLVVYGAEPGSPSQDGLKLLASWAATLNQADQPATARAPDQP